MDPISAGLAALKDVPPAEWKTQWRELVDTAPPSFNRRYLENTVAYPHPGTCLGSALVLDHSPNRTDARIDLRGNHPILDAVTQAVERLCLCLAQAVFPQILVDRR